MGHGEQAVVRVLSLSLEDGRMTTGELNGSVCPEFEGTFFSVDLMWQSIQGCFDETPGIEKTGEHDAAPGRVAQQASATHE